MVSSEQFPDVLNPGLLGFLENYHNLVTLLPLERARGNVLVLNLEVSCGWTPSFSWSCNLDLLPLPHFAESRAFWSQMIYHLSFIFTSYLENLIPQRQKLDLNCLGYFVEMEFEFQSKGKRTHLAGSFSGNNLW